MVKRKYSKRRTSKRKYFKTGGQSCKNITVCDNGDGSYTVSSKPSIKRQDASSNLLSTFTNPMGSDNTQNPLSPPPIPPKPPSMQSSPPATVPQSPPTMPQSYQLSQQDPPPDSNPPDSSTKAGFARMAKMAQDQAAQAVKDQATGAITKQAQEKLEKTMGKEGAKKMMDYANKLAQVKGGSRRRRRGARRGGSRRSRRVRRRQKSKRRHRRKQKKTRRRY